MVVHAFVKKVISIFFLKNFIRLNSLLKCLGLEPHEVNEERDFDEGVEKVEKFVHKCLY